MKATLEFTFTIYANIRTGIMPGKPHDNIPNVTERDSANKIDTMSPGSQTSCS